jgi:hypothetical protein
VFCSGFGRKKVEDDELPCACPAGDTALFTDWNVEGDVTGAEMKRHFMADSPDPIRYTGKKINAWALPYRRHILALRVQLATVLPRKRRDFRVFMTAASRNELRQICHRVNGVTARDLFGCQEWLRAMTGKIELPPP